ncbi:uncharacterized protein ALTATR162_LOCUS454 [Alternaria atra]|uniref:Uncharacterized protein n=1 Tax=Alternaria atra TaxID=119953 RepID=A0A8J2HRI5_9PLEO|nr:uncharacterized protein ALTATR162_LOCUS454 [Alternaria atra]CAG5138862.1 unnamed protein product [Alternaria atra]
MLQQFSSKLLGKTREATFDALYSHSAGGWHQQDDIVHPFSGCGCVNDHRHVQIGTVWTFDLDSDILRMDKEGHHGQIPLELAHRNSIAASDFESYDRPLRPKSVASTIFPPPYSELKRRDLDLSLLKRREAFWLTYAVVRIVALDFTIVEINLPRRGTGGYLVRLQDLPNWEPWNGDIIRVGGVSIVMCQYVAYATRLIRADFKKWTVRNLKQDPTGIPDGFRTYLILSVHELIVYQINSHVERYTKAKRLFDNTGAFSPGAVDLLLKSTQHRAPTTCIDDLPIELQDMILDKIGVGPLERAKLGCNLQIGPVFKWKCDDRSIEREEGRRNRIAETPVESQIWFDGCFSGVAYK